jgi:hypothetical protein
MTVARIDAVGFGYVPPTVPPTLSDTVFSPT